MNKKLSPFKSFNYFTENFMNFHHQPGFFDACEILSNPISNNWIVSSGIENALFEINSAEYIIGTTLHSSGCFDSAVFNSKHTVCNKSKT